MPIGIDSLGIVLFVRAETGSFARAGLVAAAFGLGVGFSAPALGRLIDRHGARPGHAAAGGPARGRRWEGSSPSGWRARPRPRWWHAAWRPASPSRRWARSSARCWRACSADDASLLPTAYALDGIAIELVFVTGPLLTAAILVVASPAVALLVACALRPPRHRRARGVAGLTRLAAGRPPARAPSARRARLARACAPSSPRPPPSASPSAPPR